MHRAFSNPDIASTVEALQCKLQALAHAEYEHGRRRLGQITPEQERAIEALLQSTVSEICHPLVHRMRRSYETGEAENMQAWRDIFGLEG